MLTPASNNISIPLMSPTEHKSNMNWLSYAFSSTNMRTTLAWPAATARRNKEYLDTISRDDSVTLTSSNNFSTSSRLALDAAHFSAFRTDGSSWNPPRINDRDFNIALESSFRGSSLFAFRLFEGSISNSGRM